MEWMGGLWKKAKTKQNEKRNLFPIKYDNLLQKTEDCFYRNTVYNDITNLQEP